MDKPPTLQHLVIYSGWKKRKVKCRNIFTHAFRFNHHVCWNCFSSSAAVFPKLFTSCYSNISVCFLYVKLMFAAHLWSMSKQIACLCTFVKLNRSWLNMQNRERQRRKTHFTRQIVCSTISCLYFLSVFPEKCIMKLFIFLLGNDYKQKIQKFYCAWKS